MKWKNPDQLSAYGVQLFGWPPDVPRTNPSTLSVSQNRLLLEALQIGVLRFIRTSPATEEPSQSFGQVAVDEMDVYMRYDDASASSSLL
jgi:hypothetical protein